MKPIKPTETRLIFAALVAILAIAAWKASADAPTPATSDPVVCPVHIVPNSCPEPPADGREGWLVE